MFFFVVVRPFLCKFFFSFSRSDESLQCCSESAAAFVREVIHTSVTLLMLFDTTVALVDLDSPAGALSKLSSIVFSVLTVASSSFVSVSSSEGEVQQPRGLKRAMRHFMRLERLGLAGELDDDALLLDGTTGTVSATVSATAAASAAAGSSTVSNTVASNAATASVVPNGGRFLTKAFPALPLDALRLPRPLPSPSMHAEEKDVPATEVVADEVKSESRAAGKTSEKTSEKTSGKKTASKKGGPLFLGNDEGRIFSIVET